jgi:hypothetical protein
VDCKCSLPKSNATAQEKLQVQQLIHQRDATIAEVNRQEAEGKRIATEQVSDRIRIADEQLGAARVTAGERGVSASTMQSFARAIGFAEGLDTGRLRAQNVKNIAAGEASKKNAELGVFDSINIVQNQKNTAINSATLNFIGSGLQIAAGAYAQNAAMTAAHNPRY